VALAVANGIGQPIFDAIQSLARQSKELALAVSYIQPSGWELLKSQLSPSQRRTLRIVCDDQMGITNPEAVRRILSEGGAIRAYADPRIFHPKVYLGKTPGTELNFVLGSANLSEPALLNSIEAVSTGKDSTGQLADWFDDLFDNHSVVFDDARLDALAERFARRVKADLGARRGGASSTTPSRSGDLALIDELFGDLGPYVAPLSFNLGKNNVRSLETMVALLKQGPRNQYDEAEIRFAGLSSSGQINKLGQRIAKAKDVRSAARLWIPWLRDTPTSALPSRKLKNLEVAKRAYARFWQMQPRVREYFLANAVLAHPPEPELLQAIELLANASLKASTLSLDNIRTLAPSLTDPSSFPVHVRESVRKYMSNNGTRSWGLPERRDLLEAWRHA
jgi:HKD family nuclease